MQSLKIDDRATISARVKFIAVDIIVIPIFCCHLSCYQVNCYLCFCTDLLQPENTVKQNANNKSVKLLIYSSP